jgi:hypothetical protein
VINIIGFTPDRGFYYLPTLHPRIVINEKGGIYYRRFFRQAACNGKILHEWTDYEQLTVIELRQLYQTVEFNQENKKTEADIRETDYQLIADTGQDSDLAEENDAMFSSYSHIDQSILKQYPPPEICDDPNYCQSPWCDKIHSGKVFDAALKQWESIIGYLTGNEGVNS